MRMYPERIKMVKKQYPVGTRIQLDSFCNDERGMPSGLCGTVVGVDDQPALLMKWDNGRSLNLLPFDDSFTVLSREPELTPDEQLYDKLHGEQQSYTKELLTLPPSKILEKAWEYLVREDILITLACGDVVSFVVISEDAAIVKRERICDNCSNEPPQMIKLLVQAMHVAENTPSRQRAFEVLTGLSPAQQYDTVAKIIAKWAEHINED